MSSNDSNSSASGGPDQTAAMKIGFIGTGAITEAMVVGLLRARFPAREIIVSPRSETTASRLAATSSFVRVASDNQDVVSNADVIFLAVRPQIAEDVIRPLVFGSNKAVGSLIATIPIPTLRDWIGPDVDISRAVPLPAVAELNGVTVVHPGSDPLTRIFDAVGTVINCETIDEFDAFAAAGAVMATYFAVAETCAQWLCSVGVPYDKARTYLAPFFHGLTGIALSLPQRTFEELRMGHTTVGGLNEQVFERFRDEGGLQALRAALDAVAERLRKARDAG